RARGRWGARGGGAAAVPGRGRRRPGTGAGTRSGDPRRGGRDTSPRRADAPAFSRGREAMTHRNGLVAALCCVAALTGCGASTSPELADARLSVERAKASEAPRYAPASVHDAEKLLARAESEKDGSRL